MRWNVSWGDEQDEKPPQGDEFIVLAEHCGNQCDWIESPAENVCDDKIDFCLLWVTPECNQRRQIVEIKYQFLERRLSDFSFTESANREDRRALVRRTASKMFEYCSRSTFCILLSNRISDFPPFLTTSSDSPYRSGIAAVAFAARNRLW